MTQKTKAYREQIAEQFLNVLQEKQLDWKKEWAANGLRPLNAKSGYRYRGINLFHLALTTMERGYQDPRWATFKQIEVQGWKLKNAKGQGVKVEYWFMWDQKEKKAISWEEYRNRTPEEGRYNLRAKYSTVFNGSLIEGIPPVPEVEKREINVDELIGRIAKNMEVEILNDGGERAFYNLNEDRIHLPEPQYFYTDYAYNSTALHELTHASGAAHRLNREMGHGFGTEEYAFEELVAEISSCFVSENLQIEQEQAYIDNHKAYVQSWIKSIREQPETLVRAIQQAEKAANYLEYKAGLIPEREYTKQEAASMEIKENNTQPQKSEEEIQRVLTDVQQKTADIREDTAFFNDFIRENHFPDLEKEKDATGYYVVDDLKTGKTVKTPNGKELRTADLEQARELTENLNRREEAKGDYIYTEKGEKRAKELGLEERKAGTTAMLGHEPLQDGITAQAWKEKGYVARAPKL